MHVSRLLCVHCLLSLEFRRLATSLQFSWRLLIRNFARPLLRVLLSQLRSVMRLTSFWCVAANHQCNMDSSDMRHFSPTMPLIKKTNRVISYK